MSQHLPLVAAQPGIWMARLLDLPSAWSVAHYVELTGDVDAPLLARAVVVGLAQADACGCVLRKITAKSGSGSMMR
ncbi:condensation domain-containing protein [Escherichia coli]